MEQVDFSHFLQRASTEDPFFKFLKMEIEGIQPGNVKIRLFIDENFHTNRRGVAHGSPLAAMSDACMGWSSRSLGYHVVTINIDISYLRPVSQNTWVHGEGRVVHHGKRTTVCEVRFHDDEGNVVLIGKGTYWIHHPIDISTDI